MHIPQRLAKNKRNRLLPFISFALYLHFCFCCNFEYVQLLCNNIECKNNGVVILCIKTFLISKIGEFFVVELQRDFE